MKRLPQKPRDRFFRQQAGAGTLQAGARAGRLHDHGTSTTMAVAVLENYAKGCRTTAEAGFKNYYQALRILIFCLEYYIVFTTGRFYGWFFSVLSRRNLPGQLAAMAYDTTDIFHQANDRMAGWATSRLPDLKASIAGLGIRHLKRSPSKKAAVNSLKKSLKKERGLISRIGFSIPRHMIYVHKGVGQGTTIDQVGSTNRKAKPWYNPVIDAHIDELADIAAEEIGSAIINNILIR